MAWAAPVASWIALPLCYRERGSLVMLRGMGCLELSDKTSPFVKAHLILNVAIFGGIPFAVMAFVYFRVFKISRRQNKREHLGKTLLFSMKKSGMTAKWLKAIGKMNRPFAR